MIAEPLIGGLFSVITEQVAGLFVIRGHLFWVLAFTSHSPRLLALFTVLVDSAFENDRRVVVLTLITWPLPSQLRQSRSGIRAAWLGLRPLPEQ